jgi:hypothetical protein
VSYLPVAAGFAAIAFLAAPAHGLAETAPAHGRADTQPGWTVELHQSDVVAAGFGASDCSDFAPDQPIAGQEGWVFQAPVDGGRLRTVQLRYATSDGVVEVALDAADGGVSPWGSRMFDNGTEVWLTTPAGWTLLDGAAAVARPTASDFNLIRTCRRPQPAQPAQVSSPELKKAEAAPAGAETITVVVGTPSPTPSSPAPTTTPPTTRAPGAGQPPAGRPPTTGGRLPVTGAPLGWLIAAALALIGIGVALRAVRRRELPVPGN